MLKYIKELDHNVLSMIAIADNSIAINVRGLLEVFVWDNLDDLDVKDPYFRDKV
jgi:hypothetical protein